MHGGTCILEGGYCYGFYPSDYALRALMVTKVPLLSPPEPLAPIPFCFWTADCTSASYPLFSSLFGLVPYLCPDPVVVRSTFYFRLLPCVLVPFGILLVATDSLPILVGYQSLLLAFLLWYPTSRSC